MSEYISQHDNKAYNHYAIFGVITMVVTQCYLSYVTYLHGGINGVLDVFLSIFSVLVLCVGIAYIAFWSLIVDRFPKKGDLNHPKMIVIFGFYAFVSAIGYLVMLYFWNDVIEDISNPIFIYTIFSLLILAIECFLVRRKLNSRIKEVHKEYIDVYSYIEEEIENIKEDKLSYGYAFQRLVDKRFKKHYEDYAMEHLRVNYCMLTTDEKVKDFEKFSQQFELLHPVVIKNIIYFPTYGYRKIKA